MNCFKGVWLLAMVMVLATKNETKAQLVHGEGQFSAGMGFGIGKNCVNTQLSYNYIWTKRWKLNAGVMAEKKEFEFSTLNFENIEGELQFNYARIKDIVFLNFGIGVLAGVERSKSPIFTEYIRAVSGELLSASVEVYATPWLITRVYFKQRFVQFSRSGDMSHYGGIAVAYNFSANRKRNPKF